MTSIGEPTAIATSTSRLIDSRKASFEKGRTMPEVPIMEMPSTTPSLGLNVRFASSRPAGTLMVTSRPRSHKAESSLSIICLGTLLMAGPPMGRPRPGRVTRPTPSPCKKWMPGWSLKATVATIATPFVTSGSSPASLITVALHVGHVSAPFCGREQTESTGRARRSPSGKPISTESPTGRPSRHSSAALAAAVAQAPVVKPLRSGKNPGTSRSIAFRSPNSPVTISKPPGSAGRRTAYTATPAASAAATFPEKPPDSPLSLVIIA